MIIFFVFFEPLFFHQKLKSRGEHGSARWSTLKEIKKNFRKEKISNIKKVDFRFISVRITNMYGLIMKPLIG